MTSGLYLITSRESDRKVGCVVNTLVQVASAPPTLAVALNKDNVTTAAIDATGRFAAAVLSEAAPMELTPTNSPTAPTAWTAPRSPMSPPPGSPASRCA